MRNPIGCRPCRESWASILCTGAWQTTLLISEGNSTARLNSPPPAVTLSMSGWAGPASSRAYALVRCTSSGTRYMPTMASHSRTSKGSLCGAFRSGRVQGWATCFDPAPRCEEIPIFAPLSHNTTANNQEANFPSKHFVFFPAGHSHPAVRCASTAWPADVDQRRRHALCRGERLFLQPLIFFLFLPRACLGKFWGFFHRERFPEFTPE